VVVVVVVVLLVVGVVGLASHQFMRISRGAQEATLNGLPSVQHLTAARTRLRDLDAAMDAGILRKLRGQPFDPALFDKLWERLGNEIDLYAALPMYPGEPELYEVAKKARHGLDEAHRQALRVLAVGDLNAAHEVENGAWRVASDRLDEAIDVLLVFNAAQVSRYAERTAAGGRRAVLLLSTAALVSALLALLALRIAVREIRQRQRELAARAEEWETFSSRVAHDLMSPLQVVSIAMDVATERCSNDEHVTRATSRGASALRRLRATTDALLNFARSGGRPARGEHTPIGPAVAAALDELGPAAEEASIALRTGPISDGEVGCSAGVLHTLVTNLVRNAIKHMGERPEKRIEVRVLVSAKRVRFEVEDTGPGIDSSMLQRIFMPLVRGPITQAGGIGLGLATVKRMTEAHGGAVGVRSVKDQGSIFWFELPRV
jgi:signal transduction histidine kinase